MQVITHNQYLIGVSVISIGLDRPMPECNHEEADARIVVHVLHAILADQAKSVVVRTVDADVIVFLVGKFHYLGAIQPEFGLVGRVWNRTQFLIHKHQHHLCWSR